MSNFKSKNVLYKDVSNVEIDSVKIDNASKIMVQLQKEAEQQVERGYGPFLAAIYDEKGNLIAKVSNSVVTEKCSNNRAEMNTIKAAEKALNTYDLAPYNLSLYVNPNLV